MDNIFLEATNNIRAMHEIESILNNDDIPVDSRSFFLRFISISFKKTLTSKQQKNVNVFRELFVRVDRDTRLFRSFLNFSADIAEHFKFENTSLVYAFRNISLEEHFTHFVDFARRKNPIIAKDNPLYLFLTLGFSLIKLALHKNKIAINERINRENKKLLFSQYKELSIGMSERFINMDFGNDIKTEQDDYSNDLDNFNMEDDTDTNNPSHHHHSDNKNDDDDDTESSMGSFQNHIITTAASVHSKPQEKQEYDNNEDDDKDIESIVINGGDDDNNNGDDDDVNIEKFEGVLGSIFNEKQKDNNDIFKTLENGDKELNLQNLDSLVKEAGLQIGPMVFSAVSSREPIVNYDNGSKNMRNVLDFISYENDVNNNDDE